MHRQLRSSQTINTNIFYLWKPPGAQRRLRFHISWLRLILDVILFPVCTQEGFCHHRNVDHFFHSVLFIFIVSGGVLAVSSQDIFFLFLLSLGSFEMWHGFILLFSTQHWALEACVRELCASVCGPEMGCESCPCRSALGLMFTLELGGGVPFQERFNTSTV